jgi:diguanylate cyclase (GGDEF)-like protein
VQAVQEDLMQAPGIPRDEEKRVETLRQLGILDTDYEERFDRLTRLASHMFGTPIALVTLIDQDHQWFKSCVGLDSKGSSRDVSFCAHAILGDDSFVIPDAKEDDRFSDNPFVVQEPHIRFYAGHPIKASNGSKLGTICIIDDMPRDLGESDREALQDLAEMVEREIAALESATIDELTNVLNRRGFELMGSHSLNLCSRRNVESVLVYLDLNDFKEINDASGHAEGDKALVRFADHMKRAFRESDVYGRIGGDEFALLLIGTTKEEAESTVDRLRRSVTDDQSEQRYHIAFSHGIVEFDPKRHGDVRAMLDEADRRMSERTHKRRMAAEQN